MARRLVSLTAAAAVAAVSLTGCIVRTGDVIRYVGSQLGDRVPLQADCDARGGELTWGMKWSGGIFEYDCEGV